MSSNLFLERLALYPSLGFYDLAFTSIVLPTLYDVKSYFAHYLIQYTDMGDFNRDRRSGGRRDFRSGGRGFGGRDGGRREMHKTVCSKCGNECEVPFVPHGDRPVFCDNCFDRNRDSGAGRSDFGNRRFDRPRYDDRNDRGNQSAPNYKEQFDLLNAKLDQIIEKLSEKEEPKSDKPVVKKGKKKTVAIAKPSIPPLAKIEIPPETS